MTSESPRRVDPAPGQGGNDVATPARTRKPYVKPAFTKFDLVTFTHGALAVISPDGSCYFS
jgi:hypothetical protein